MLLHELTWPEVESYLQHHTGVIIPIGSTEQHGPSGMIGTDAMVADAVAREIGLQTGYLVAPLISVGVAEHHMAFSGTLSLRPSTLIALLMDYLQSLAHHGFRDFLFINGHGGNVATLRAAFSELHTLRRQEQAAAVRCTLQNWYEIEPVVVLRKQLYGDREGRHATPSEIAVVQYLRPDLARPAPSHAPSLYSGAVRDAEDFRTHYPDGRVAAYLDDVTPEQGRELFQAALRGGCDLVEALFTTQ